MPPKSSSKSKGKQRASSSNPPPKRARGRNTVAGNTLGAYGAVDYKSPIPADHTDHKIFVGKRLVKSYLIESEIIELLEYQGWSYFLEFEHEIWGVEVWLFYQNLGMLPDEAGITSNFHGSDCSLTPDFLANKFHLENDHLAFWFDPSSWPDEFDIGECTWWLTFDSPDGHRRLSAMPSASELGPSAYILYLFVTKCILAKDRQDMNIDGMVGFVMWKILTRVKLNLPFYLIRHMFNISVHKNKRVPYGQHLSAIFEDQNFQHYSEHVITPNEKWNLSLKDLRQAHIYLHLGSFIGHAEYKRLCRDIQEDVFIETGREHERRQARRKRAQTTAATDEDAATSTPASFRGYVRTAATQDIIDSLQNSFNQRFDRMEDRFEQMSLVVDGYGRRIDNLESMVGTRFDGVDRGIDALAQRFSSWHFPDSSQGGPSGGGGFGDA